MARLAGVEPATHGLAYHYNFHCLFNHKLNVCGLDHLFTISGVARMVSTELCDNYQEILYLLDDYFLVYLPLRSI